jgi:ribonucleoside-diphosphate reductase alpha chain
VKYLIPTWGESDLREVRFTLDFDLLGSDVDTAVRAFDNVLDRTHYPLAEQKHESEQKRRMGVGVTGVANALETMGFSYGSDSYIALQDEVLDEIRGQAVRTSCALAQEKGSFPAYSQEEYLSTYHTKHLPEDLRGEITRKGIRNGTLLSIAPTGTISMCADNVSAGIEPPYALRSRRLVHMPQGQVEVEVEDFALREYNVKGRTAQQVSASDHIRVLCAAQRFVDSAVSKTCNVDGQTPEGEGTVGFDDFKELYSQAYKGGAKGCTTFNINGKRFGIIREVEDEQAVSCEIDPLTGAKSCEV